MRASRLSVVALVVSAAAALTILSPSTAASASDPYEVLHSFTSPPSTTIAGLIEIGGKLYGVSREGGASDLGTAFEVDPATGRHRVLYSFSGGDDGALPSGRLAWVPDDPAGAALYGTTLYSGTGGAGTVFRLTLDGKLTTLQAFSPYAVTGSYPQGGLVLRAADGWLYGTTSSGGANGVGILYRIAPGRPLEVVHSFDSGLDGAYPYGELAMDTAGTLYGVAPNQGYGRYGTIYRVRFDGATPAFEMLYTLTIANAGTLELLRPVGFRGRRRAARHHDRQHAVEGRHGVRASTP